MAPGTPRPRARRGTARRRVRDREHLALHRLDRQRAGLSPRETIDQRAGPRARGEQHRIRVDALARGDDAPGSTALDDDPADLDADPHVDPAPCRRGGIGEDEPLVVHPVIGLHEQRRRDVLRQRRLALGQRRPRGPRRRARAPRASAPARAPRRARSPTAADRSFPRSCTPRRLPSARGARRRCRGKAARCAGRGRRTRRPPASRRARRGARRRRWTPRRRAGCARAGSRASPRERARTRSRSR